LPGLKRTNESENESFCLLFEGRVNRELKSSVFFYLYDIATKLKMPN